MSDKLVVVEPSPNQLMEMMISKGLDKESVEVMQKLIDMKNQEEDRNARKAFIAARAGLQADCEEIVKSSTAEVKKGDRISYRYPYAKLETIERAIRKPCEKNKLSYYWTQKSDGKLQTSTCVLEHVDGHTREASYTGPIDSENPRMSESKKAQGTNTVGKRNSLIMVTGLTVFDPTDTDGNETKPKLSKGDADALEALVTDLKGEKGVKRVLEYFKVGKFTDLTKDDANDIAEMVKAP